MTFERPPPLYGLVIHPPFRCPGLEIFTRFNRGRITEDADPLGPRQTKVPCPDLGHLALRASRGGEIGKRARLTVQLIRLARLGRFRLQSFRQDPLSVFLGARRLGQNGGASGRSCKRT